MQQAEKIIPTQVNIGIVDSLILIKLLMIRQAMTNSNP